MEDVKKTEAFLTLDYSTGYGSGFGDGNGSGFGYGDGSGFGYGDGDGYGNGDGSGFGDGNGSGFGYGDGYGSGDGSGDGSGNGSGDGWGIKSVNGEPVYTVDGIYTMIDHIKGNVAKGRILRSDLTFTSCFIVKQGQYFAHGETLHSAMEALRDKLFDGMSEEERIEEFVKRHQWGNSYSTEDYYIWHHRLTGSCEMGRKSFASDNGYPIDGETMLTVEEFIRLTENAYGGEVIRKLKWHYWRKRYD